MLVILEPSQRAAPRLLATYYYRVTLSRKASFHLVFDSYHYWQKSCVNRPELKEF